MAYGFRGADMFEGGGRPRVRSRHAQRPREILNEGIPFDIGSDYGNPHNTHQPRRQPRVHDSEGSQRRSRNQGGFGGQGHKIRYGGGAKLGDSEASQRQARKPFGGQGNKQGHNGARPGGGAKPLPEHYIKREDILQLAREVDDYSELLTLVNQNEAGFLKAYQNTKFFKDKLLLESMVKLLFNLTEADDNETTVRLLSQIFSTSNEFAAFLTSVYQHFKTIPLIGKSHFKVQCIEALSSFVKVCLYCMERIPKHGKTTIEAAVLKECARKALLNADPNHRAMLDEISGDIEELQKSIDELEEEELKAIAYGKPRRRAVILAEMDPPEPFTDLTILPTVEDLSLPNEEVFLRPNIVEDGYNDWEHYLDIQFRLLREDFVRPLRQGISDFLEEKKKKLSDVRVYTNVRVLCPVSLGSGMGFDISFNCDHFQRLNWNYTKRLINGSLLCISSDNFKTVAFATVAVRKVEKLQQGIVTVKFEGSVSGFQFNPLTEFKMVESVAFFEAYRHILARLQEVFHNHDIDTMPFRQYIVDCVFADVPLPVYARYLPQAVLNLQGVVQLQPGHRHQATVDLANTASWPPAAVTDLDPSQLEAMKAALTQQLSVIQGPPGTGKTYIGLKIVQGLLANRRVWDPHKKSPILVVCYTNHALDQFLEGIMQHPIEGKSPDITRIGGRSKSDLLKTCTLYEKVQKARAGRSLPLSVSRSLGAAYKEMMRLKNKIEATMSQMSTYQVSLLADDILYTYLSEEHKRQLLTQFGTLEAFLRLQFTKKKKRVLNPSVQGFTETDSHSDSEETDSENEVQIILNDRLVDGYEQTFRPRRIQTLYQSESEEEVDSDGWETVQKSRKQIRQTIRSQLSKGLVPLAANEVGNLAALNEQDRWRLYIYWRDLHMERLQRDLERMSQVYDIACKEFLKVKDERDAHVALGCDVVGMTTTGAAKYNHLIKSMKPKIVIVEEAAEIFEPHIFTSLSPSVQQLVLIGDHQQLRPKPTCYELETEFKFNVSLFERLAKNGFPVQSLKVQHRMRPDIAKLITPAVYKELLNHESVEKYENIKGVGKNLFFIHHKYPEESDNSDRKSHSNPHEAAFLTALCDYLIKQGYEQKEITMLTLYSGQVIEIKKHLKRKNYQRVRTVVVDDYQGEENEIIILSLVRSNSEGNIGFVAIENRVCVALSRAKKALFIMGNKYMLASRKDTIWPQVLKQLKSMDGIGESLPLYCQNHQDTKIQAKDVKDFDKCPQGGCTRPCNTRLNCGHTCTLTCHPRDKDHLNFKCKKIAKKKLPLCGHDQEMRCSEDVSKAKCQKRCSKELRCGHVCSGKCSAPCEALCRELVDKKLDCGHTVKAKCHLSPQFVVCSSPCKSILLCGHECSGTCGSCERGRLHEQCQHKCGRTLVCEHICSFPCTPSCPPCTQACKNYCVHSQCPRLCFEPCEPCQEPCKWSCKHKKCTKRCGEPCNRTPCNKPCPKKVCKQGHQCIGICGEPCPQLCRICDKDEVTEIFFGDEDEPDALFVMLPDCGHVMESKGLDQWMKTENDGVSHEVTYKKCPKCSTPIKKCLRYSNEIKQYLRDMDKIKAKQLQSLSTANLKEEVKQAFKSLDASAVSIIAEELEELEYIIRLDSDPRKTRLIMFPHVIKAKLIILSQVAKNLNVLKACRTPDVEITRKGLEKLRTFLRQDYLFEQQLSDAESELRRLTCLTVLCEFNHKVTAKHIKLPADSTHYIRQLAKELQQSGWKKEKVTQQKEKEIWEYFRRLGKGCGVDGLTDHERKEIVQAVGLGKGHWFKCPKGHFYVIGECGGAMERAKCPECGATIGGMNHALDPSNRLASEMDGAQHAAWSEAANNMANFEEFNADFDHLQLN